MTNLAVENSNPHSKSNAAGLHARARRLANPVRVLATGYRRLAGKCTDTLLVALLIEIDETLLPRRIRLVTDTGHSADLFVTDRRLMRIAVADQQNEPDTTQPACAATLIAQLRRILDRVSNAVLLCKRAQVSRGHSDPGCTSRALAAAASLDMTLPPDPDVVPDFVSALSDQILGWVRLDPAGNCLKSGGNPDWIARLESLARDGLADIDAQLLQTQSDPDQPGCIVLSSGGTDAAQLLYARSQVTGVLAILPASALPDIQPAWRALFS